MKQKSPIFVLIAFVFLVISLVLILFGFDIYFLALLDDYYSGAHSYYSNMFYRSTKALIFVIIYNLIYLAIGIIVIIYCFLIKKRKTANVSLVYLSAQIIIAILCLSNTDSVGVYRLGLLVSAIGILKYVFDLAQNRIYADKKEEINLINADLNNEEATLNLKKLKQLKDNGVLTEEEFAEKSKIYIKYL